MNKIINSVKPLVYYFKSKAYNTSDTVFKMHTKLTVYLLLICSIIISTHAYNGRPIECIVGKKEDKESVDVICWVSGTYTLLNTVTNQEHSATRAKLPHYQQYYQWVITILLIQAALFSIPARLWKAWEHGRIEKLCGGLNADIATPDSDEYRKGKDRIINYLKLNNSRVHRMYFFRYVACEVMNFLNVILNMYILNTIFGQFWCRYLPAVLSIIQIDVTTFRNLASEIFPTMAKCYYTRYGPSGTLENRDALCLLTLNVVNEKVFAFLYVWYVLLLLVSGCNLICRSVILLSSSLRLKMIQSLTKCTDPISKKELRKRLPNNNVGDWFVIFLIGRNINPIAYRDLLEETAIE